MIDAMKQSKLTQEILKHWLLYEPDTGVFRWLHDSHNKLVKKNDVAGSKNNQGYINITLRGKAYKAHRLAWLYMTGSFPISMIDHKNRNKSDNSWGNLREADRNQNQWNAEVRTDNKSGVKGVHFCTTWNRWIASIRANGVRKHLGRFETKEEAQQTVIKYRSGFHGEYAN
jgi:hypothetical protein